MAAFCAICIDGVTGLRPRRLTDGGPIYIICEECDERDPAPPFEPEPTRPTPFTRGGGWVKKRYQPLDVVRAETTFRILETVKHAEWSNSLEIADLMGVPSYKENAAERNKYSVTLSRLRRTGFLERRKARSNRGGNSYDEYKITELGLARLENAVRCTFQRMPSIAA